MSVDSALSLHANPSMSPQSAAGEERPRRERWIVRLSLLLCATSLLLGIGAFALLQERASARRTAEQAEAQLTLLHVTDAIADKTNSLFSSLNSLTRLSGLVLRLSDCCAGEAADQARAKLVEAVEQSSLAPLALEVRDEMGRVLLSIGSDPPGAPNRGNLHNGPGLPWRLPNGHRAIHFSRKLPGQPALTMRVTIDLDLVAAKVAAAAPSGATTRLYRLDDGAELSPLSAAEVAQARDPVQPTRHLDSDILAHFASTDLGAVNGIDANGRSSILSFETIREFGLAVMVVTPRSDAAESVWSSEEVVWLASVSVFLFGLLISSVVLIVVTRQRAQMALQQQHLVAMREATARRELEDLVRCSPAMLYRGRVTAQGEFVRDFLTPNTVEITGWTADVLNDPDRLWELLSGEDRLIRNRNHLQAAREGRSLAEYRLERPDGSQVWLRNEAVAVGRLADGSVELAGAISNITREREIADYAAMQNRLASLGEFSASLAHELTQPMTVIGIAASLAERLIEGADKQADLARHLATIEQQVERASEIVRHLRAYGRTDSGALTDVSLADALQSVLGLLGKTLGESAVDVVVDLPADLPRLRARRVQVEQILVNLLINARDAMAGNPPNARRVTIRAMRDRAAVRLEVEDTGPGVPAELLARLFEPFFTTKPSGEGSGLGLALCQTMMRQFGGSISATNGRLGAVFTLRFPVNGAMNV
jgi:C4-dicarboxylate-specific signal transduction histidine kinase